MRLPNSYGSISKLSGKRRKPYMVRKTVSMTFNEETMTYKQKQKVIGYFATRAEAIKALADFNDCPVDFDYLNITLNQCYEKAKERFTESRKRNYYAAYKYLEPIKDMPLRQIKGYMLQECVDKCKTTQQTEIVTLCHKIYNYALERDYITKDASRSLHSNSVETTIVRNVFTSDEIKYIEECDEWFKVVLACLIYSGMRASELRSLAPGDIDLDNLTINIRQAKNKTSVRKIPIHTHAEPFFRQFKDEGIKSYPKTQNGLNKAIAKHFETEHHGHDTRHTFTTRMRECKCDPLILQKLLGHRPESITQRVYTHITMDEMRQNLELLHY